MSGDFAREELISLVRVPNLNCIWESLGSPNTWSHLSFDLCRASSPESIAVNMYIEMAVRQSRKRGTKGFEAVGNRFQRFGGQTNQLYRRALHTHNLIGWHLPRWIVCRTFDKNEARCIRFWGAFEPLPLPFQQNGRFVRPNYGNPVNFAEISPHTVIGNHRLRWAYRLPFTSHRSDVLYTPFVP